MTESNKIWDNAYKEGKIGKNIEPDDALIRFQSYVPPGKILDIGMGVGRHSLYFARRGHNVTGIDLSQVAIDKCLKQAETENLSIKSELCEIHGFPLEEQSRPDGYSLIIASMMMNGFKKSEVAPLITRIKKCIKPSGLFYFSAFSTDDPRYVVFKKTSEEVEEDTFFSKKTKRHLNYFTEQEVAEWFMDWKLIYKSKTRWYKPEVEDIDPKYQDIIFYLAQNSD